jgi:hypothetical protein
MNSKTVSTKSGVAYVVVLLFNGLTACTFFAISSWFHLLLTPKTLMYAFHVPIFAFIGGLLFSAPPTVSVALKKLLGIFRRKENAKKQGSVWLFWYNIGPCRSIYDI